MQVVQREIKIRIKKNVPTKKDLHLAQFEEETAIWNITRTQLIDIPQL